MITNQEIILIIGMTLVTFAARYPVMVLIGRIQIPERAFKAFLRYVPVPLIGV